ncbi:MAG: anti-sigma factor family protein [Longimicrobiales bacterium]
MSRMSCERVAEKLPDRLQERIGEIARLEVDEHLAECADCRSLRDLMMAMGRTRPAFPEGLHERVLDAVASPRRRQWIPSHVAMAATVVFALITAGLLLSPASPLNSDGERGDDVAATVAPVRSSDPLLHGGPGLGQLSVDELQRLLAEMDS